MRMKMRKKTLGLDVKRTMTLRTGKRKRSKRKKLTFLLELLWGHHGTPDPHGLEAPRTQASVGPEVPCPPSHPQDLRVEPGEGGPLPQVTWRHSTRVSHFLKEKHQM